MKRILSLSTCGLLLAALSGCHLLHGVCDCDPYPGVNPCGPYGGVTCNRPNVVVGTGPGPVAPPVQVLPKVPEVAAPDK